MAPANIVNTVIDLAPDTVILNEIDKISVDGAVLEIVENIQRIIPVIIGTANSIETLPSAFLRPGRFDELMCVDTIDATMFSNIINFECPKEMADELRGWPVAFVSELRNRYDAQPKDLASHYSSLKTRVEMNKKKTEKKQ